MKNVAESVVEVRHTDWKVTSFRTRKRVVFIESPGRRFVRIDGKTHWLDESNNFYTYH